MSYRALLFCPDEKTARTVTQVLSELEFAVESCTEPFAAVKKLMGQHFDALVVDCDHEQNATLLFKSARNSASNHSSLAVALVEGQGGVAKAFRIGANLVLTKPINAEQAKGTVRVARGLLRKSEAAKPAAIAPPAMSPGVSPQIAAPEPIKAAARVAVEESATSRPAAVPPAKSAPAASRSVGSVTARSIPNAHDDDLLELNLDDDDPLRAIPPPAAPPLKPAASQTVSQLAPLARASAPLGVKLANPLPAAEAAISPSPAPSARAASAPAPAPQINPVEEAPANKPASSDFADQGEALVRQIADLTRKDSAIPPAPTPAPAFTFGGVTAPAQSASAGESTESSPSGSKKILLAVLALVLLAAALYIAWTQLHGKINLSFLGMIQPAASEVTSLPPAPAVQSVDVQTVAQTESPPPAQPSAAAEDLPPPPIDSPAPAPAHTQPSKPSPRQDLRSKPRPSPRIIVTKSPASRHVFRPVNADDPAPPTLSGMGTEETGTVITNIVGETGKPPRPTLQPPDASPVLSPGILIKSVPPKYPSAALQKRIEGSVHLLLTIGKTGKVSAAKAIRGEPLLVQSAVESVRKWKYQPYLLNGQPVEMQTQVIVKFTLPR